ncbi:MAG: helix-turn-helix transcriptional regulator [Lentimonas sp.]
MVRNNLYICASINPESPIALFRALGDVSFSLGATNGRFLMVFEQTPSRFLISYRLTRASQLLMHSDETISVIAQEVGFYDHSHFTREFQKLFGLAPGRYRRKHTEN